MQCDRQNQMQHKTPCTGTSIKNTLIAPYNSYGPKDFKLGDETQKIIHFTFVF